MSACIWCKRTSQPRSVEHIIPEAIACPPGFVLQNGEVCRGCNNRLAVLDRVIAQEFDLVTFWYGVPRKRGRPPQIDSRGNFTARVNGRRPEIKFIPKPRRRSRRNVSTDVTFQEQIGEITVGARMGEDPRFVRAILKIALSAVAYFNPRGAADSRFDEVRDFVTMGKGTRRIVWWAATDKEYRHYVHHPFLVDSDLVWIFMRLGPMEFAVDLSEGMQLLERLVAEVDKARGGRYTVLPPIPGTGAI
jgi:hypothetical protein